MNGVLSRVLKVIVNFPESCSVSLAERMSLFLEMLTLALFHQAIVLVKID